MRPPLLEERKVRIRNKEAKLPTTSKTLKTQTNWLRNSTRKSLKRSTKLNSIGLHKKELWEVKKPR